MKVPSNIKKFITTHAASRHVMYIILWPKVFCFGESLSYEALFLRMQRQSQSFQFSLSFLYFWWDRFLSEYVDLAIYTSYFNIRIFSFRPRHVSKLGREICLFLSFFSESETISCWWSGAGQITISFVAVLKYWQTRHLKKILRTVPWLQGQWFLRPPS